MKKLPYLLWLCAQPILALFALAQSVPAGTMSTQVTEIHGTWTADVISLPGSEEVTLVNVRVEMSSPVFGQTVFHVPLTYWADERAPSSAEQFVCRHFGFSSVKPSLYGRIHKKLDGDYVIIAHFEPDNSINFEFRQLFNGNREYPASVICIK